MERGLKVRENKGREAGEEKAEVGFLRGQESVEK